MTTPPVLIVGVSGFVGRHVARAFLDEGCRVRGLTRDIERTAPHADPRIELVRGDMTDGAALARAVDGVDAVVYCAHTLSTQPGAPRSAGFMDIEHTGVRNLIAACHDAGARRVVAVTSIGVAADAGSTWLRERHRLEQALFGSDLDVTVFRPGLIVGAGGAGFDRIVEGARRRVATTLSPRTRRLRPIAVEELAELIVRAIDEPRTHGRALDVGTDDILTTEELTSLAATALGGRPPRMVHLPRRALRMLAPLIDRIGHLPPGAVAGMLDGTGIDLIGDPAVSRELFGAPASSYRRALDRIAATTDGALSRPRTPRSTAQHR